jgi:hypothetical protein
MSIKLVQLDFHTSKADTSLYIYHHGTLQIFLLIYVDDIIITSSSDQDVTTLLNDL